MENIQWVCEICKKLRDDKDISVVTYPLKDLPGAERNLNYCNDDPSCKDTAMKEAMNNGYYPTKGKFILDEDGNPKEEKNLYVWGKWFEENQERKRVAFDDVGDLAVSTVFLGLDYTFGFGDEKPALFETMVFKNPGFDSQDEYTERYATKEEALKGHKEIVEKIKSKKLHGN